MIDKIDEKNLQVDIEELNNICDECKEEDESVTQNLILTGFKLCKSCLLYTSPSPRDVEESRMPSSA